MDGVKYDTTIYTDNWLGYDGMSMQFIHQTVNHMTEYVRGIIDRLSKISGHCLKRTLTRTYVAVEAVHGQISRGAMLSLQQSYRP